MLAPLAGLRAGMSYIYILQDSMALMRAHVASFGVAYHVLMLIWIQFSAREAALRKHPTATKEKVPDCQRLHFEAL